MPAPKQLLLSTLRGTRVVAAASSIDNMAVPAGAVVLRLAPDDVLVLPSHSGSASDFEAANHVAAADPDAIAAAESGFSGAWLQRVEFDRFVGPHIEWEIPAVGPALAQGLVAGVPAKVWVERDDTVLLLCATAYVHEMEARLG